MYKSLVRWGGVSILIFASTLLSSSQLYAQDGAALFKAKCAACHAADGSGSSQMGKALGAPDLRADVIQKETDAQLTDGITNGKGTKMPAYKGKITDDQIKGLVGYIRDLAKK